MFRSARTRAMGRSLVVVLSLAALLISAPPGSAAPRWRHEQRSYVGFGYLNLGVTGPGTNVDCTHGVGCVEIPLHKNDYWAAFKVADVTGQTVSGWALGWTNESGWVTLDEFCGGQSWVPVVDQERFAVVFSTGIGCTPDGVVPTVGDVSIRIGPKSSWPHPVD